MVNQSQPYIYSFSWMKPNNRLSFQMKSTDRRHFISGITLQLEIELGHYRYRYRHHHHHHHHHQLSYTNYS